MSDDRICTCPEPERDMDCGIHGIHMENEELATLRAENARLQEENSRIKGDVYVYEKWLLGSASDALRRISTKAQEEGTGCINDIVDIAEQAIKESKTPPESEIRKEIDRYKAALEEIAKYTDTDLSYGDSEVEELAYIAQRALHGAGEEQNG